MGFNTPRVLVFVFCVFSFGAGGDLGQGVSSEGAGGQLRADHRGNRELQPTVGRADGSVR